MQSTRANTRKKELEKKLENFLSNATIEALRDKLYIKYNLSNSFLHPDVYQVSQELDVILLKEQKKMLEECAETIGEKNEGY